MPVFSHAGFQFHFEQIGVGRPIVLGHGLTADSEQIKQLVGEMPGWQLIVWDCRGHGLTEPDPGESQLGFDIFAADLAALLDHLSVRRAVIGGLSMGAGVAARFAIDYPERTDALVMLRPAWIDQPHPPALAKIEEIARVLHDDGPDEAARWIDAQASAGLLSGEMIQGMRQQTLKPRAQQRSARLLVMPAQAPIRDAGALARMAQLPSLITFCQDDPLHPPEVARWWASRLANSTLHELPVRSAPNDAHRLDARRALRGFLAGL